MPSELHRDQQLQLIKELCRKLAGLGLAVGMSDARPSAVLRKGVSDSFIEMTVDPSGSFFEWFDGQERHTALDPFGAATRLREYLRTWGAKPTDPSWFA